MGRLSSVIEERYCVDPSAWRGEISHVLQGVIADEKNRHADLSEFDIVEDLACNISLRFGIDFPPQKLYRLVYEIWQQEILHEPNR